MQKNEKYNTAFIFAAEKHKGQFRKGGLEYITHPMAVAEMLKEKGYGIDCQLAGLFHDLLEDTDATEAEIEVLAGKDVLEAVKLLTKVRGYSMEEYIAGIKSNPMAMAVKVCDRLHNIRCAVECDEAFKKSYIAESRRWYADFGEEILFAVDELEKTLQDNQICRYSEK